MPASFTPKPVQFFFFFLGADGGTSGPWCNRKRKNAEDLRLKSSTFLTLNQ